MAASDDHLAACVAADDRISALRARMGSATFGYHLPCCSASDVCYWLIFYFESCDWSDYCFGAYFS